MKLVGLNRVHRSVRYGNILIHPVAVELRGPMFRQVDRQLYEPIVQLALRTMWDIHKSVLHVGARGPEGNIR